MTQNEKKTYFGNFVKDSLHWSSIDLLREKNYTKFQFEYIDFLISKKYNKPLNLDSIYVIMQDFANDFCKVLFIDIPVKKPIALVHQNHGEITNMTAFWDGACGGHIYGFQIWNEFHTEGFGFGLIKHEFGHYLFNENFENHFPPIIAEGVIEYYFNHLDSNKYQRNLNLAKHKIDSLNFHEFLTDEANFFGLWQI